MKLTKSAIDQMTFKGKTPRSFDVRYDDTLPRFGVRILANNKKFFVVRYRFQGQRRYLTLGAYGVLTLQAARDMARKKLADVANGLDPVEEKIRNFQLKTFAEFAEVYLQRHGRQKKSLENDKTLLRLHVLDAFSSRKLESIKRADVAAFHAELGSRYPIQANRALALISKMFSLASIWGFVKEGYPNPAKGVARFKENKRLRYVTHEEMPRVLASIEAEPNPYLSALFLFYLTLGLRKRELRTLKWSNITSIMQRSVAQVYMVIEETKTGKAHHVPVPQMLVEVLKRIPRQQDNPYVFCGRLPGQPLKSVNKAWERIRERAGVEDVTIHDLRRTVGSWLVMDGNSLELIGKIFQHSNTQTTKGYAVFAMGPVQKALEEHSAKIIALRSTEVETLPAVADDEPAILVEHCSKAT